MKNTIRLHEHFCNRVITKSFVDEYNGEILSKMKELQYTDSACYAVAAISLFLDTLRKNEREEILNILNLQEKQNKDSTIIPCNGID